MFPKNGIDDFQQISFNGVVVALWIRLCSRYVAFYTVKEEGDQYRIIEREEFEISGDVNTSDVLKWYALNQLAIKTSLDQ